VPEWALIDIGVNDTLAPATGQAAFEASLGSVLDKIHAAWPSCQIRVAKVWARGRDALCDTVAGYIDNVLSTRAAFAAVGHDERVWMKGADDGATMSYDGVHYSAAGNAECAVQWHTAMGY
jgi:hypothetical protein